MSLLLQKLGNYLVLCSVVLPLLIIGRATYNIFLHPLRKYPGPWTWAASRLFWAYAMQSGNYHHKLHHFHERYGPVVRIAPNELSYISSHAWQDIYGNPSITKNRLWALQEEKHHPVSILSTDEATHLRNRRALAGAFTDHAIAQHAALLERIVELMIEKFKASVNASSGLARVNVVDWFNFLTFDISGALSFGETFDCVRNGREHPWVEISCSFGKGIALMASINFFQPLNHILELAMPKTIMAKMKYHKQLSHEKLQRRLLERRLSKAQDYVGSIQAYNKEKGETKIPVDEIEANMTVLIFAGSETTSTALSAVMNQLLQSPVALEKARAEVRSAFDNENDISVSSVAHLEYLGAVIKEGIRMGPPAAVGMPRTIPKEGAIIMGQQVPGHTLVAVNQYPAFRSSSNFSSSSDFVPERFLANTPFPEDQMEVFEPFLLGRHKCIGQKLAWAIMRLTLARMVYAFDMEHIKGPQDFGDSLTYVSWEKKETIVGMRLCN